MRQCLGEGVAPVFLVTLPEAADTKTGQDIAGWIRQIHDRQTFDLRPWYDAGEHAPQQDHVSSTLELRIAVRERLNRLERARRSPDNLVKHNPAFVGRVREMTELRASLVLNKLSVVGARDGQVTGLATLQGLGGLGKTELALAYAHAFAWDYPGGRWQIGCEHIGDLRLALLQLARPLEFEFTDEENKNLTLAFERVLRELNQRQRCLLLLDNISDPSIFEPEYLDRLPRDGRVDIIATTRLAPRNIPGSAQAQTFIAVDELPGEDALALLRSHQPHGRFQNQEEDDHAREIVRLLEGFTLAVETAGIYLGRYVGEVTCAQFLRDLRARLLEQSEEAAGDSTVVVRHRERLLEKTLSFTLETLSPETLHVLTLAALLPADSIPLPWLKSVGAEQFAVFSDDHAIPNSAFHQTKELLMGLRLFQTTGVTDADGQLRVVRMHRLVQELMKKTAADARPTFEASLLSYIRGRAEFLWESWVHHEHRWELSPLVASAWQWMEQGSEDGVYLANHAFEPLLELGKFAEAEGLVRRALEIDEQRFGPDDPNFATDLNNLATLLQATNRLADAEPLMRRVVEISEKSLGEDHPNVASALSNLALLLKTTNRLEEAEAPMRRVVEVFEKTLPKDHPKVAFALNNLAQLLQATNWFAEAEPLMRRVVEIFEKSLGKGHPNVASALNNLAHLLKATNRLSEVEPLIRRALDINEQSFGPGHPDVALILNNLAQLLQETNRLEQAEPLMLRALEIDEQSLGPRHHKVAIRLNNLAQLLQDRNRLAEAEPLMLRALEIDEQSFGANHPNVASDLNNLAQLLQEANRLAEAEPLMRRALEIDEQNAGLGHPDVATDLRNLAQLLQEMNRLPEAEPLLRRALRIDEQSVGPDHLDVARDLNLIAAVLVDANRFAEAKPLMRQVIEIYLRLSVITGNKHPHLPDVTKNYAAFLFFQMGYDARQVKVELDEICSPFGIQFGGGG